MSPLFFKRLSDEILGSRLASGEAAAFDELYRRYSNRLAAYGAHLLGDAGLGDDVAQATMLRAYGALREGRVPNRMKPWLFRIAHNAAIDLVVRRRELPSDDLPEPPTADREQYAGTLIEALATLPDRQRRAYVLREVHGLRIDETAAELGLTTSQVEQALFAARNRLAEQLVFGDRLNCVTVQRLAAGPLDTEERRALKTHLRTCHACRQTLGVRGRALSVFPAGMSFDWLARLGPALLGGGAPAAAKVGAVVATATIAAGGTVAVETGRFHAHRPVITPVAAATERAATPVAVIRHVKHTPPAAPLAAAPVVLKHPAAVVAVHEERGSDPQGPRHATDAADRRGRVAETRDGGESGSRGGGAGGHRSGDDHAGDHGSPVSGSGSRDGGDDSSGSGRTTRGGIETVGSDEGQSGDGGDHGGAIATSGGSREGGDRHGGDRQRQTTTTTTTIPATTTVETDGSHGGGDGGSGGGGGDSGGGGGDSGGGGSGGGGGGSGSGGGGGDGGAIDATPDLPLLDSSGH